MQIFFRASDKHRIFFYIPMKEFTCWFGGSGSRFFREQGYISGSFIISPMVGWWSNIWASFSDYSHFFLWIKDLSCDLIDDVTTLIVCWKICYNQVLSINECLFRLNRLENNFLHQTFGHSVEVLGFKNVSFLTNFLVPRSFSGVSVILYCNYFANTCTFQRP